MRLTNKEVNNLKREVKKVTGAKMADIEIVSFADDFIAYNVETNYSRATGAHKISGVIER